MLRLWGRLSSINVRKVVLAARWLGLTFERIEAGREFGVVDSDEFLAKNPNGLIPLLEDDDLLLWESNVIVRYLCAKYAMGSLYPSALPHRFDAERWMDWQQTTLNPAGRDAFVMLIRTSAAERSQRRVDRSIAATEPLLALLDRQLSQRAFVAGETVTMADFPLACEVHRWRALPIPQLGRPHLDAWYARLSAHPAARGVLDLPLA